MAKYIIELEDNQMAYTTTIIDGVPFIKLLQTLLYTAPDLEQVRKEAYDAAYADAVCNCSEGCSHVKQVKEEAYLKGLNDGQGVIFESTQNNAFNNGYKKCLEDMEQVRKEERERRYEDGYCCGLDAAWKAAKKIARMDTDTSEKITGYFGLFSIMDNLTADEVIAKIKQYEKEQDAEIKVGDEVESTFGKGVVVKVEKEHVSYIYNDGSWGFNPFREVTKTGRTFPEIAAVLEKMQEGQDG